MKKASKTFHGEAYRQFRGKLRDARKAAQLTQRQAAALLRKPPSYIAKIETGDRRLDVIELQAIAKVYKKPITFFLND